MDVCAGMAHNDGTESFRSPTRGGLAEDGGMAKAEKHCLLVVDDEPDLVQSVKDLLRFDYKVLIATRAVEGLQIMQREKVHIVMSDQRMPEMTGVEFLKHLRDSHPETVRLLFTAYADLNAVT